MLFTGCTSFLCMEAGKSQGYPMARRWMFFRVVVKGCSRHALLCLLWQRDRSFVEQSRVQWLLLVFVVQLCTQCSQLELQFGWCQSAEQQQSVQRVRGASSSAYTSKSSFLWSSHGNNYSWICTRLSTTRSDTNRIGRMLRRGNAT